MKTRNPTSLWWEAPRVLAGFVIVTTILLALRKPWALHTPQFWAEDGEIFMKQDDSMGARAILEPYNGYLHVLPRLIAWIASHTADVAWWPAIYNGFAFALNVALFARLASPRVVLSAKPWLMLAFVLVVGTGEVLINVTNLQWVVAFFLVLQLFTTPPTTTSQRVGDIAIIGAVGLSGPFPVLMLPLFVWRAWRDQNRAAYADLLAVAACAGVQGWLITRGSATLSLHAGPEPFRPAMMLSILGSRLVTWPVLGPKAVHAWPLWVHGALAVGFIGPLLAWAVRRDPRRPVRTTLVATFVIITAACAYRARADTWADDNLVNGDRYFYISRVLLAWLVILECDAHRRMVAYAARAICILAVATHVPYFKLPTPKDYKWAEHCDPIRRGVPANIYTLPEDWFIEYTGRPPKK
jgi:hypothetical protein